MGSVLTTDKEVQALLVRQRCPTPLHTLRTMLLGQIASPRLDVSPMAALALLIFCAGVAATSPALAQALDTVVRGATIARDTIVAITLLLMTVGVGIAGYKIMFAGASFRDVSNLLFGGALAGAATAIAAVCIA